LVEDCYPNFQDGNDEPEVEVTYEEFLAAVCRPQRSHKKKPKLDAALGQVDGQDDTSDSDQEDVVSQVTFILQILPSFFKK
jgi:hypothetical protein